MDMFHSSYGKCPELSDFFEWMVSLTLSDDHIGLNDDDNVKKVVKNVRSGEYWASPHLWSLKPFWAG